MSKMTNPSKWREHSPYEWQEWANERMKVDKIEHDCLKNMVNGNACGVCGKIQTISAKGPEPESKTIKGEEK